MHPGVSTLRGSDHNGPLRTSASSPLLHLGTRPGVALFVSILVSLPEATNDSLALVKEATWSVRRCWRDGYRYSKAEAEGIHLSLAQKRWWVRKAETLGGDMKREYPATPNEAFEQALEGAYFAHDLYAAHKDFRRVATRYDRLATNYLAAVCLAATVSYWL